MKAIQLTRRICAARALAPFEPKEILPGPEAQTEAQLLRAAGDIGTTLFHPVGTCKMGDDNQAVVDARLRVQGIAGLRVVDASIMPTITSGNVHSPVIMIAEKASDMIRQDRRSGGRNGYRSIPSGGRDDDVSRARETVESPSNQWRRGAP